MTFPYSAKHLRALAHLVEDVEEFEDTQPDHLLGVEVKVFHKTTGGRIGRVVPTSEGWAYVEIPHD